MSSLKVKGSAAVGASATDEEATNTGAEPGAVPVFSSAGGTFCADLSSESLESFSPS